MDARKGCWTCKARKMQCDGGLPACERCVRGHRECQGYEMRLSWPRSDDTKRAITGGSPPLVPRPSQEVLEAPFINATSRDVELYRHLSLRIPPLRSTQHFPVLWGQPQLTVSQSDLVDYFRDSAYLSLVTFDLNPSNIRDTLLRMSMTGDTVLGRALLDALLAFSSLRRSGLHQQALQLKISTLHSLSTFTQGGSLSLAEAAHHLAASMLLGSFEILLPSGSSDEWLRYIWGARDIVEATRLGDQAHDSDIGHLLGWFYYHESLSRFPIHHWRHKSLIPEGTCKNGPQRLQDMCLARHRPSPPCPNPTYAILNLLSEACDTLLESWDPRSHNEGYHDRLSALERRIESLPAMPASSASNTNATLAIEVYQTTTRVYLARASQSSWEPSTGLDSLIDRAFAIPIRSCACTHFFPVFILACEARIDKRRATILSLIGRAETSAQGRHMAWLRQVIQSVWVQHDLHADSDLLVDYLGLINAVIGSSNTLPSFV